MRLWHRVFLIAVAVLLLVSGSITLGVSVSSLDAAEKRAQEDVVGMHVAFAAGVENALAVQRSESRVLRLSDEQVEEELLSALDSQRMFAYAAVQKADGTLLGEDLPAGVEDKLTATDGQLVFVSKAGEENTPHLTVISDLSLEGKPYVLVTGRDAGTLYSAFRARTAGGILLCAAGSLAAGLLLWAVCRRMLRPLAQVNTALQRLAAGEFGSRMEEAGSGEFRLLAQNVNRMAGSVEQKTSLLQETADSRKRFADSMAHEMKTPLTSILCMADLLRIRRSVTDKERQEYAGVIVEEARRMKALSTKLLTLASADKSALEFRESSLSELLEGVRSTMQPILEQRNLRLTVAGEDVNVWVDRQLFQTLVINLVDNAAKASADGQKVIVCHAVQDGVLLLAVIDEGIGMTKEQVRHATEAFWMADKSRSRKAGGAGLGLALCEEIAKLHGATLRIESEPGRGTTVQLHLPLRVRGQRYAEASE